jgi:hypothetical protein
MNELSPQYLLGTLDILGGLVMVWAFQRITTFAGWRTYQQRWALFRRALYVLMAIALFGLGIERVFGDYRVNRVEWFFQTVLLLGVMVFPVLRAAGLITQDIFLNGERRSTQERKDAISRD